MYLCSPSTAAASALTGRITDPSGRPTIDIRPAEAPDTTLHDTLITARLSDADRATVVVERGPNLVSPPLPELLPDSLEARVLITVGDDISTGDMAPDGAIAMSVWSNIALCARFMFNRLDTEFHDRAKEWGGGVILAGDNYGQGSSREHAALIPLYLGVRVIAATSYARIHRRNLIAAGIAPLILPANTPTFDVGTHWNIVALRQSLQDGADTIDVLHDGGALTLTLDLTPGEREVLAAGGLLAHIRGGGRRKRDGVVAECVPTRPAYFNRKMTCDEDPLSSDAR